MTSQTRKRPGRNEPCYCGSGRKYKQCCLGKDEAAARQAREETNASARAAAADAPLPEEETHASRPRTHPAQRIGFVGGPNPRGFKRPTSAPRKTGGG